MARINQIAFGGQGPAQPVSAPAYQSQLADAILARGMNTQGIQSPVEGFAKMGEAALGALTKRRAVAAQQAEDEKRAQAMAHVLGGAGGWTDPDTGKRAPGTGGANEMMARLIASGDAGLLQEMGPSLAAMQLEGQKPGAMPKPPTTRERKDGDSIVTDQWVVDDKSPEGQWVEVGRAPRWDPNSGAKVTVNTPPVNVTVPNETVFENEAREWGKQLVSEYQDVSSRAQAAEDNLANLHMLRQMDVSTGAIEPAKAWVAGLAESFGYDPTKLGLDGATNAQAFTGIAQNLVLTKMQAQKGPQTESDAKRIQETIASLGNTPDANKFITDAAIALEERKVEQRDFYQAWRAGEIEGSPGNTLKGVSKAWNEYKRNTPLLAKNPNTGLPVFFTDFKRQVMSANPGATVDDVLTLWREKYATD